MAVTQKIFAYNTGPLISGTTQVGDIAVSEADVEYSTNFGGLQWWGGPDETTGYVIAHTDPSGSHDGAVGGSAYLGFWRSSGLTDSDFLNLCNSIPPRIGLTPFTNTNDAYTWLNSNGYWTSFTPVTPTPTPTNETTPTPTPSVTNTQTPTPTVTQTSSSVPQDALINPIITELDEYIEVGTDLYLMFSEPVGPSATPSPTPTNTETPTNTPTETETPTPTPTVTQTETETPTPTPTNTETPTNTPTVTQTPSSTDLTNITTYTISGCTSLNVFVANLGPGALAPGDVFYFEFTGGTPSGCYRIVNKIDAVPTDGTTPLYFYSSCALCVAAREVTPTPTVTQTQTTTPTNTPTPSVTPIPVTGYGYNLIVLPYNAPSSGNTIFPSFSIGGSSGITNPNTFNVNGVYWNIIDNLGVNRSNYYSGMTGVSVTAYFTQNGDTAIYSGSTTAFTLEGPPGQESFNYNPNTRPNQLTVIQSANTNFITGQTVYISFISN